MTASSDDMSELNELLHGMCDSRLDATASARLAEILTSSKEAQRQYIEFMDLCVGIAHAMPRMNSNDSSGDLPRNPAGALPGGGMILPFFDLLNPPLPSIDPTTLQCVRAEGRRPIEVEASPPRDRATIAERWLGSLRSGVRALTHRPWLGAAAALLLLSVLSISWIASSMLRREEQLDVTDPELVTVNVPASDFAARIVSMTDDTTWENPHAKVDPLFRIAADETLRVATGMVKLEFFSGAEIILRAPAVFTPTGPDSGRLDHGQVTGKVSNGNFRLTTKVAEVIDLGTEFGVSVDDVTGTDVLVFDGEVEVVTHAVGHEKRKSQRMTEGMATRFTPAGTAEHDFPAQPGGFSRFLSPARDASVDKELSLVDVICGGSGFDNYLTGAIDPRTGKTDSGMWLRARVAGRRRGEGLFFPTRHRPPLDGVFIPPVDGNAAQIDSLGHMAMLPVYTSQTFGPIWARRQTRTLGLAEDAIDYWGTDTVSDVNLRLQAARHGLIGMHANVGFTFDLQSVRMRNHFGVTGFEVVLALLEPYRTYRNPENIEVEHATVDFFVYVDGILRHSQRSIKRADGEIFLSVPLTPSDQRLTLVTTDGDHSILFDNFVLIDPVLKLDKAAKVRASE